MEIERHPVREMTIEQFADEHGLTMEVHERGSGYAERNARFYAKFKGCDVAERGCLCGVFGNGNTEAGAIAEYAKEISEKILAIDGFQKEKRRDVVVPRLVG